MTTQPNASDVEKATKIVEMVMQHMDELSSCVREISEALSSARLEERKRYEKLVEAAKGLSHGVDWNNGTHAKTHGYRQKLLDALKSISTDVDSSEGKG